jgi:hypothetical protein
VGYLASLPFVQAVGMVGVCTSAGNAAYLAAEDPRVKAIATVAAFLPEPSLNERVFGAVPSATHELPEIRRNPAEMPRMKNSGKIGISSKNSRVSIDRRVSVAPMMDWND